VILQFQTEAQGRQRSDDALTVEHWNDSALLGIGVGFIKSE
jgi:hypothetical protein